MKKVGGGMKKEIRRHKRIYNEKSRKKEEKIKTTNIGDLFPVIFFTVLQKI